MDKFDWVKDSSMREKVFAEYRRIRNVMLAECVSDARNELFFKNIDMVRVAQSIGIDTSFDRKVQFPAAIWYDWREARCMQMANSALPFARFGVFLI